MYFLIKYRSIVKTILDYNFGDIVLLQLIKFVLRSTYMKKMYRYVLYKTLVWETVE